MRNCNLNPLTLWVLSALATGSVYAQEQQPQDVTELPPIVVQASKSDLQLDKINSAVSVALQDDLHHAHINNSEELSKVFPELYFSHSATFLFPIMTVRGVTSAQDFYNPALTVYVDGVPQISTFAAQSLLNVEQVELLKGPQGTLYGKSAQGGILNIVSQKPDATPQFAVQAGVSSRHGYQLRAEGSGELIKDWLYGSATIVNSDANGDISSQTMGRKDLNGMRNTAGNVKLRLAPTGKPWEINLSAGRDCTTADQEIYTLFDDYHHRQGVVRADLPTQYQDFYQKRCANSVALNGQYDFDIWRLNVIASDQHVHTTRRWPLDAYFPVQSEQWKQNTQEIRLATRETDEQRPWDAVFGLYRQQVKMDRQYLFDMVLPSLYRFTDSTSHNKTETLAAYGNLTWHITPQADIEAGARFSQDKANTHFYGANWAGTFQGQENRKQNTWLGHVATGYQFTPNLRAYATVSQGYKPLGYNLAPSTIDDAAGFGRERSISYETGLRYTANNVRANLAVYRINTKDIQLYGDGNQGNQTLRNVGDARSTGVELNTEWDINHALSVGAGGFINKATFRRFEDSSACTGCQGNKVPLTPKYGLTLSAKGRFYWNNVLISPQVSLRRVGTHYFDVANKLRQDAYNLLDANIAIAFNPHIELMLYGQNLTNKAYRTYGFTFAGTDYAQVATGRTLGVNMTLRY